MTSNIAVHNVPNSAGTAAPALKVPANSADCHIHIYDPRFAPPVAEPAHSTLDDYRLLQKRLGVTRVVIVTPRNYVTDNRATVDAIAQLGPDARGVAVVHPTVTDADLTEALRVDPGYTAGYVNRGMVHERMSAVLDHDPDATEETQETDDQGNVTKVEIKKKRRPKLYDSMLEQGIELCGLLRDLNVTNDPALEEARRMLESRSLFAKRRRNVKEAIFMADKLGLSTGEVVVKDNNLEKALKTPTVDRSGVIIEIFSRVASAPSTTRTYVTTPR